MESYLKYHSCLFTAVSLDAEWTRRSHVDKETSPETVLNDAFKGISNRCVSYKKGIDDYHEAQQFQKLSAAGVKQWAAFYSPLEYVPIGHDDAVSLVLLDEFEALISLTSQCYTTVEGMDSGYLPDIQSLLKGVPEKHRGPWMSAVTNAILIPEIAFTQDAITQPLLLLSRFKLNGLTSLGTGTYHQETLMKAALRCVGETLQDLINAAGGEQGSLLRALQIEPEDVAATRFFLVDLLGQEELGLVFFTSNWSIPAAIASRIQSLRYREVLEMDHCGGLELALLHTDWFQALGKFYQDLDDHEEKKFPPEELLKNIKDTHVMRWVRSSASIRKNDFFAYRNSTPNTGVKGFIDATTFLRLAAGHQTQAEALLNGMAFPKSESPKLSDSQFQLHHLGASDLAWPHQSSSAQERSTRLIPASHLLQRFYQIMEKCTTLSGTNKVKKETARESQGRCLVSANNLGGIPVPCLFIDGQDRLNPQYNPEHHLALLETCLPILKRRLTLKEKKVTDPKDRSSREEGYLEPEEYRKQLRIPNDHHASPTWAALSPLDICMKPRDFGLPVALVRTLEFLYHNYSTILANPYTFDSVLDLYDVFASFHGAVTTYLPPRFHVPGEPPDAIPESSVTMITGLVDALRHALDHRMYRLFPEEAIRDMNIDFRGGLNALVQSADAVVKLGVGVLRHQVLKDAAENRFRVGVVTRIGFHQGIHAVALRLGVESSVRLGIVETDVPHLYHLPSYVDFLHEAFHLVYDALRNPSKADAPAPMLPLVPRGSKDLTIEGRLAEVFSNLLTALVICPDNPRVVAEHMTIQYTTSPRGAREFDQDVVGNLLEHILHLYCVYHLLEQLKKNPSYPSPVPWWWCHHEDDFAVKAEKLPPLDEDAYIALLKHLLPVFSANMKAQLAQTEGLPALISHARDIFQEVGVKHLQPFLPIVLAKACQIQTHFWYRAVGRWRDANKFKVCRGLPQNWAQDIQAWVETAQEIKSKIQSHFKEMAPEQGTAEQSILFSLTAWSRPPGDALSPNGRTVDPLFAIGEILSFVLHERSEGLFRHGGPYHAVIKDGLVFFPDDQPELHQKTMLIRRGGPSLFTANIPYRNTRLSTRIAILKILSDASSILRSNRLAEMFTKNLSVSDPPSAPEAASQDFSSPAPDPIMPLASE